MIIAKTISRLTKNTRIILIASTTQEQYNMILVEMIKIVKM